MAKLVYGLRDIPEKKPSPAAFTYKVKRVIDSVTSLDREYIEGCMLRLRTTGCHFLVVEIPHLRKWACVTSEVTFAVVDTEENAVELEEAWRVRCEASLRAVTRCNEDRMWYLLPEFMSCFDILYELMPNLVTGRLPSMTMLDPEGGFWSTTRGRDQSRLKPIFCPTFRLDLDPPLIYYQLHHHNDNTEKPSSDAPSHGYILVGLQESGINCTFLLPMKPPPFVTTGLTVDKGSPFNDIYIADKMVSDILSRGLFGDEPLYVDMGGVNTLGIFSSALQMQASLTAFKTHLNMQV